jgi:hypothetical protein
MLSKFSTTELTSDLLSRHEMKVPRRRRPSPSATARPMFFEVMPALFAGTALALVLFGLLAR